MKRYYVAPMVEMIIMGASNWVAKPIKTLAGKAKTVINTVTPTVPNADGTGFAGQWALCLIETPAHGSLLADADLTVFPDLTLDAKVSSMAATERNTLQNRLAARGIDISTIHPDDGYRMVLRKVGRMHQPSFSENDFDATL